MGQRSGKTAAFDSALKINKLLTPFDITKADHFALVQNLETVLESTKLASFDFVRSDLPPPDQKHLLHANMITYFALAWSSHASVVLSPDMVFYTLLAEIAGMYSKLRI
jgi:hypothetical protein